MNEIMTGSVDTRSVVSAMTLALLEDSGWYKVNYSMAEQLDWGQNQGTEFLMSRCDAWNGAYHCNSTHASGCTYNREAEGYCPIVRYPGDLPVWARYFPEANRGMVMSQSTHFLLWWWLLYHVDEMVNSTAFFLVLESWVHLRHFFGSVFLVVVAKTGGIPRSNHWLWEGVNAGGQSSLADYCAYFVAYSDGSCIDMNSARSPDRMLGETRGRDSRWAHVSCRQTKGSLHFF